MLWGEEVGRLAWDASRRLSYFVYNPEFLKRGLNLTPLLTPVQGAHAIVPVWGEEGGDYQGLPAFLSDALPDRWGRQLLDLWVFRNNLTRDSWTPLDYLSLVGKRAMGAFEFLPASSPTSKGRLNMRSLTDFVARFRKEGEKIVLTPDDDSILQMLASVGASTGGRQPKMCVTINRKTGQLSTAFSAREDCDDYLLKFGDPRSCSAEIEMTYYAMAVKAGIRMMSSGFYSSRYYNHFVTKRFDRINGSKLLVQSLAAIAPQSHSYEELIAICRKLHLHESDCQEVFRRMVFNYLSNNTDDHPRNIAFLTLEDGSRRLSPAYDLTPVFNPVNHYPIKKHYLSIGGKCQDITQEDFLRFARDNGIRRPTTIIRDVVNSLQQFRTLAQKFGVSEIWTSRIQEVISSHL